MGVTSPIARSLGEEDIKLFSPPFFMTKSADRLLIDAQKAASLIKQTAETTATALNIQYIQKDILEIKVGIKSLTTTQDTKIAELEKKIDVMQKQVWVFSGGIAVLAFVVPLVINRFLP